MRTPTTTSSAGSDLANVSSHENGGTAYRGLLIVNADDWGRDRETTDRILECAARGSVSSTSAMVFMADSERAAAIARERRIDTGLHLNFTETFTAHGASARLKVHHQKVHRYLRSHRLAQVVFHPGLSGSFQYVVESQIDEYRRLYGVAPERLDGHHHMHLCANVVYRKLLPCGTVVRRNFSFQPGDKGFFNRTYRRFVDGVMSRRHKMPDYLFSMVPFDARGRLERIFSLAHDFIVELETHPANPDEHQFLTGGEMFRRAGALRISPGFELSRRLRGGKSHDVAAA